MIRPIRFVPYSVNQRLPSGPAVIPEGTAVALMPAENVVTRPLGVMRPIRPDGGPDGPAPEAVNQRLPSGPAAMSPGPNALVGPTGNSVTAPRVVIRPIRLPMCSVNQRFPSAPAAIAPG